MRNTTNHRRITSTASTAKPTSLAASTSTMSNYARQNSASSSNDNNINSNNDGLINMMQMSSSFIGEFPASPSSFIINPNNNNSNNGMTVNSNNNNNSIKNNNSNNSRNSLMQSSSSSNILGNSSTNTTINDGMTSQVRRRMTQQQLPVFQPAYSSSSSGAFGGSTFHNMNKTNNPNENTNNNNNNNNTFERTGSSEAADEMMAHTNSSSYLFSPDEDEDDDVFLRRKYVSASRNGHHYVDDENSDQNSPNSFGFNNNNNNKSLFDSSSGTQIGENGNINNNNTNNDFDDYDEMSVLTSSGRLMHSNSPSSLGSPQQQQQQQKQQASLPQGNSSTSKIKSIFRFLKKFTKYCKTSLTFHRQLIYPSSTSPNAVNYCRSITLWSVLRLLPVWYQVFSALAVVIFILFFASQNSLIGVMLSALHVTFGMEALWPAVYQKHLATVTLNERLAFAGYAVLLSVCLFFYFKFITMPKLTRDLPLMKQLVKLEEKDLVNSKLIFFFVFLPAIAEAAMAVRGNMEDVFADMGDHAANLNRHKNGQFPMMPHHRGGEDGGSDLSSFSSSAMSSVAAIENSHWRLQASALLWTIEYWKQTIIIPAVFCIAWRLIFDVSNTRYCSQRWNLVSFCAWRNIVGFVMFPHRFFCWVGAGGFLGYLAVFSAVNYCSASNPNVVVTQSPQQQQQQNKIVSSESGDQQNLHSPLDLASPTSANRRATAVRFTDGGIINDDNNNNNNINNVTSPTFASPQAPKNIQPTPYEARLHTEFAHAFSVKEAVFLTITATLRSASIIPFLCVCVLTILAGVHVVELLGLWLCVFLFMVWSPAVIRSFSTDSMAMLSFAAASILMFWLDQLSLLDHENRQRFPPLEGYEKLRITIVIAFSLFCCAVALSSWTCVILALPFKTFRIFKIKYKSVPVLMWLIWIGICYLLVFGAVSPTKLLNPFYWLGYYYDQHPVTQPPQQLQKINWNDYIWSWVSSSSSSSSPTTQEYAKQKNESVVKSTSAVSSSSSSSSQSDLSQQQSSSSSSSSSNHQQDQQSSPIIIITDEATRQVTRSVYASLRPLLLGYDNVSTDFVYENLPTQFAGIPVRDLVVWVLQDDKNPEGKFVIVTKNGGNNNNNNNGTSEKRYKLFSVRWLVILSSNIMLGLSLIFSKMLIRFNEKIVVKRRNLIIEREQDEARRRALEEAEELRIQKEQEEREKAEKEEEEEKQRRKEQEEEDEEGNDEFDIDDENNSSNKTQEPNGKTNDTTGRINNSNGSNKAQDDVIGDEKTVLPLSQDELIKQQREDAKLKKQQIQESIAKSKPRKSIIDLLLGAEGFLTNYLVCDSTIHLVRFSAIVDRLARTLSLLIFLTLCYRGSDWAAQYFTGISSASSSSTSTSNGVTSSGSKMSSPSSSSTSSSSSGSKSSTPAASSSSSSSSSESSSSSSTTTSSPSSPTTSMDDFFSSYTTSFQFSTDFVKVIVQFLAFAFALGGAIDMVEPLARVISKCMGSRSSLQQQQQQQQPQQNNNNNNRQQNNNSNVNGNRNDNSSSMRMMAMMNAASAINDEEIDDDDGMIMDEFMMSPYSTGGMNLMSNKSVTSSSSMQNNVNASSVRSNVSSLANGGGGLIGLNNNNNNSIVSNTSSSNLMNNNNNIGYTLSNASMGSISANTSFANTPSMRGQQQQDFSQGFVNSNNGVDKGTNNNNNNSSNGFLSPAPAAAVSGFVGRQRGGISNNTNAVPLSSTLVSPSSNASFGGW